MDQLMPDSPARILADIDRRLRALEAAQRSPIAQAQMVSAEGPRTPAPGDLNSYLYELPVIAATGSKFLLVSSVDVAGFGTPAAHTSLTVSFGFDLDATVYQQQYLDQPSTGFAPVTWVSFVDVPPGQHFFEWWWKADDLGSGSGLPTIASFGFAVIPFGQ